MPDLDRTAHVLIDTNAPLHFRRIDEIDWRQLADVSEVIIVIVPVLLRELEKHKVTNSSRKIRVRADKIVKWLGKFNFSSKNSIREGVFLRFIAHEPKIDFASHSLSHDIADDHLIASALDYRLQHNLDQPVFIAAGDIGLRVKAGAIEGIEILELPDELHLPSEPDKLEAENAKLRQRVAALEARIPQLSVAFEAGESKQEYLFSKPTIEDVLSP